MGVEICKHVKRMRKDVAYCSCYFYYNCPFLLLKVSPASGDFETKETKTSNEESTDSTNASQASTVPDSEEPCANTEEQ